MVRKKKRKKRRQKARKIASHSTTTPLAGHKRHKKSLIPPLKQLVNNTYFSWTNDRLPELIWISLLLEHFPRELTIELFRSIAIRIGNEGEDTPNDIRLTSLANNIKCMKPIVIDFVCKVDDARDALRPLLLFPNLPARKEWADAIGQEPDTGSWDRLALAVASSLDHQSESATDLRWAFSLCFSATGKMKFFAHLEDSFKELQLYPHLGEQKSVRPSIRCMEGAISGFLKPGEVNLDWPIHFWNHCMLETPCFPFPVAKQEDTPHIGTTEDRYKYVYNEVISHLNNTRSTTAVDSKHDTTFGIVLYSLSLLSELMRIGISTSLSSRMILRTILECFVTLAYLHKFNKDDLWSSFRVFGAGQAKLALLKLEDIDDLPKSFSGDTLRSIANEDIWQEFLDIDLGHWANTNMRIMADKAEVKEDYDRIYPWTSGYTHGHWGPIRDSIFDTCANPLHRLHRVPRDDAKRLPDVLYDAILLVDKTLDFLNQIYPEFSHRLIVKNRRI